MTTTATTAASPSPVRPTRRTRRRLGLVGIAAAVVLALTACNVSEQQFIDMTNGTRSSVGVRSLQMNVALTLKAESWAAKMAQDGFLSHSRLQDNNPYGTWTKLGENVARAGSLQAAYDALLASPGHYANIVDPAFNFIGVGVVFDGTNYWIVQEFMAM